MDDVLLFDVIWLETLAEFPVLSYAKLLRSRPINSLASRLMNWLVMVVMLPFEIPPYSTCVPCLWLRHWLRLEIWPPAVNCCKHPVHPSIAPLDLPQVGKATAGAKAVAGVIQLQECGVHGTAGIFIANVPYWMD